jgi:hypothetical protein
VCPVIIATVTIARPDLPLAEFLETIVEGYIFGDLESMAAEEFNVKEVGALGYPMVMAVLAGSELLGNLDSDAKAQGGYIERY